MLEISITQHHEIQNKMFLQRAELSLQDSPMPRDDPFLTLIIFLSQLVGQICLQDTSMLKSTICQMQCII